MTQLPPQPARRRSPYASLCGQCLHLVANHRLLAGTTDIFRCKQPKCDCQRERGDEFIDIPLAKQAYYELPGYIREIYG